MMKFKAVAIARYMFGVMLAMMMLLVSQFKIATYS